MPPPRQFLAFDIGNESGRVVIGHLGRDRLSLEEIHRFPNGPTLVHGTLYWDVLRLWSEVLKGLERAGRAAHELAALGLVTWGVDFALLDEQGELIGNPVSNRDPRTDGMMARAFQRVPRQEIFEATGIQFMQINTLYQLLSLVERGSPILKYAATFLTTPDLFNYWLTGRKVCEFTSATTTQCYDPRAGDWARGILERLGIPTHIFPPVVPPGTVLGTLLDPLAETTGCGRLPVIAPVSHDTGSAVAAVPAESGRFAYISSGTWSLMGTEVREPVITEESLSYNFTNEGGAAGTFRLLKNIMGLWLMQECRRAWAAQGETFSYGELTRMAAEAPPFGPLVDPDCPDFLAPGDMPARLADYCRRTGQKAPSTKGALLRCILESLALKYRFTLERLEAILGYPFGVVHVVGGGSRNGLLCQLTADATGRPVLAGPAEATTIGNVIVQAMATGDLPSLAEGRALIRRSFEIARYEPEPHDAWDRTYARFQCLIGVQPQT